MRSLSTTSRRGRRAVGIALMGALALSLTACLPPSLDEIETNSDAVDFEHIKEATVRIYAEGTFVEPGTLDPYEGGWYGSGFIVDPSGLIVTNYHVAGGAESMVVWIGDDNDDGDEIEATIVGYSECLDLAVIQLEDGDDYPYMAWHEGEITEGLDVYSAGFPGGDPNFTLTKGIVSKSDFEREFSWSSLQHVIEHDARIRGGNSGGPLIDAEGRVVGVNYAGDGGADDYNWAIHRDEVLDVIDDLEDGDAVQSLGLSGSALSGGGDEAGVWVQSVQADGPAEDAGILPGDVLITMEGDGLAAEGTMEEYCDIIDDEGTNAEIDVEVYRPSEDSYYEGQFNGNELEYVSGGNGGSTIEGFYLATDDSGTIEVSVPEEWADVDGEGYEDDQGRQYTAVTVTPDLDGWQNGSWEVPGVRILASEELVGEDPASELADFMVSIAPECTLDDEGEFDDGLYIGQYQYYVSCGGVDTDFVGLVATDYDNTHMIYLAVQMVDSSDKTTVLDEILATFLARY
jgi:serine protease Do